MPKTYEEVVAQLTGPGAPFEIETVPVGGLPMKNFKGREKLAAREDPQHGAARRRDLHGPGRAPHQLRRTRAAGAGAQRTPCTRASGCATAIAWRSSPTTRPDWLIALFGATSLGGIGVGLNGWWTPEEIEYGLTDSGSRFLVIDERLYPRVEKLAGGSRPRDASSTSATHPPQGTVPIA